MASTSSTSSASVASAPPPRARDQALAGACAGVAGTFLGYPLDVLKTRMQASSALINLAAAGRPPPALPRAPMPALAAAAASVAPPASAHANAASSSSRWEQQ
jgi:hypothetical protein